MNKIRLIIFSSSLHDGVSVMGSRSQLFDGIRKFAEVEMAYPSTLATKGISSEALYDGASTQSKALHSEDCRTVCFIATGGTEEIFRQYAANLPKPVILLCDGFHNSFAATMEISSYLCQQGVQNRIFTAPLDYGSNFFETLENGLFSEPEGRTECTVAPDAAYPKDLSHYFSKSVIGLVGGASSWLISSVVDRETLTGKFGVRFVDIDLNRLEIAFGMINDSNPEISRIALRMERFLTEDRSGEDLIKAAKIYLALKKICTENSLTAFTVNCFGILGSCCTTACLALALLNDEGIPAGCEGDIPALWSMMYVKAAYGRPSFMANPASANENELTVDFAHCTVPLSMVHGYRLPSHFESSIGIGISGSVPCGRYRLTKVTGECLDKVYSCDGDIIMNTNVPQRCRTQIRFKFNSAEDFNTFLRTSKGNHIIISKI